MHYITLLRYIKTLTKTTKTPVQRPFVLDYPGELTPESKTNLDLLSTRQWVAVASAGPYANLNLPPDR